MPNKTRVYEVKQDKTSVSEKLKLIDQSGYAQRSRWERAGSIDVLPHDKTYLQHITSRKIPLATTEGVTAFNQKVDATFYTDRETGTALYATVLTHKLPTPEQTEIEKAINQTKVKERSAFASVFTSTQTFPETVRGGLKVDSMPSIQLFRYDPTGKGLHQNHPVRESYPAMSLATAKVYSSYFGETVQFPHFHFINKSMATSYGKTAEADAISLDDLTRYVKDLIELPEATKDTLLKDSFGMPYLSIMYNPDLYKTAVNFKNLDESLKNNTVNNQIFNIFQQTQTLDPDVTVLTGLEAVYADLTLLSLLRSKGDRDGQITDDELNLGCKIASGGTFGQEFVLFENQSPNWLQIEVDERSLDMASYLNSLNNLQTLIQGENYEQ